MKQQQNTSIKVASPSSIQITNLFANQHFQNCQICRLLPNTCPLIKIIHLSIRESLLTKRSKYQSRIKLITIFLSRFSPIQQDFPRISRQSNVSKKLDFFSKSPIKGGFYNSPIPQIRGGYTTKKSNTYMSPKLELLYNERPTAQRNKQTEKPFSDSESQEEKQIDYQHLSFITLNKKKFGDEENQKVKKEKQKRKIQYDQQVDVSCNCRKSKCLKLYCDCFAKGSSCGKDCNCQGCYNNDEHSQERETTIKVILERNPQAFRGKEDESKHFKGCNCKKSNCQKKYCQCYQIGVECSELCKCDDCKNVDHLHDKNKIRNDDLQIKLKRIKQ